MPINIIDMTDPIEPLTSIYNLGWFMTNYTSSAAPQLPAGFVINIQGVAYIVEGGSVLPSGSPSDGDVYVKITPDVDPATATAEFTNTFSGTWSDTYNGWYDGDSIFLNVFMTKSGANYTNKGFWQNWRERQIKITSGTITSDGNLNVSNSLSVGKYSPNIYKDSNIYPATINGTTIYNLFKDLIPNVGNKIKVDGSLSRFASGAGWFGMTINYIERTSSTELTAYGTIIDFVNSQIRSNASTIIPTTIGTHQEIIVAW